MASDGENSALPCVLKRHDLRTGAGAVFFGEEYVVILPAVERRIKVDEVYRLILDVLAQDFEIVAVIEFVLFHCGSILTRARRLSNLRPWYARRVTLHEFTLPKTQEFVSYLLIRSPKSLTNKYFTSKSLFLKDLGKNQPLSP